MKIRALVSTFAVAGLFYGCGAKSTKANDALNGFLFDASGDYTQDTAALAENQSDMLDEVASSINENGSGGSAATSLNFADATPTPAATATSGAVSRTCTENSPTTGKVTVVVTLATGQKSTLEKKGRLATAKAVSSTSSGSGTLTRVWTPANPVDAVCNKNAHFKFKEAGKSGSAITGLTLAETEDRTREMSVTKDGKTLTQRKMVTTGTRNVSFASTTDSAYTYEKTVDINTTRKITLTKPNGTTIERTKTITTPTDLTVKVKRNATTGELESKSITQGVIESTVSADSTKVTTTFANLTYDFTSANDNACTPVSGKVSGTTYKSDAVVKSYEIDYGADSATFPSGISMKLGDAAAVDCPTCVAAKCDFE
ncbi:MAG: hypothetical protein RIR26_43 [Pseudomonadota bacterium]|jgi:hypothetical protein